jgi:hypothetical protein
VSVKALKRGIEASKETRHQCVRQSEASKHWSKVLKHQSEVLKHRTSKASKLVSKQADAHIEAPKHPSEERQTQASNQSGHQSEHPCVLLTSNSAKVLRSKKGQQRLGVKGCVGREEIQRMVLASWSMRLCAN